MTHKPSRYQLAIQDIINASININLVGMMGWQDLRQRYKRSMVGPFWITISMGVMIGCTGFLFGRLFGAPNDALTPSLALGMIVWGLISTVIGEGCGAFVTGQAMIRQLTIPLFTHVLRLLWRNVLQTAHNMLIYPIVMLILGLSLNACAWLAIPGVLLLLINLGWMTLVLAIAGARYRDITQIVGNLLQVMFFATPIMWLPDMLKGKAGLLVLMLNPFNHMIALVRMPLLGTLPSQANWIASVGMAVLGWGLALTLFTKYRHRISYWL